MSVAYEDLKSRTFGSKAKWWLLTLSFFGIIGALLFGYLSEVYLKRTLQKKMDVVGLKLTWSDTHWGLGKACLSNLKWFHPHMDLHGSTQALCVGARWRLAWPPIAPEYIQMAHAKFVIPIDYILNKKDRDQTFKAETMLQNTHQDPLQKWVNLLPLDLDLEDASVWLTQDHESVASLAINVRWRPLVEHGARAILKGQVRLRGLEEPLDIRGSLTELGLTFEAPTRPWQIFKGRQSLSLSGLRLPLKTDELHFKGLEIIFDQGIYANINGRINLGSHHLSLDSGELRFNHSSFVLADQKEAFKTLEKNIRTNLALFGIRQGITTQDLKGSSGVKDELFPLGSWFLEAHHIQLKGEQLEAFGADISLEQMTLKSDGMSVKIRASDLQNTINDSPLLWTCLGTLCQNSSFSEWQVELSHIPLKLLYRSELSRHLPKILENLILTHHELLDGALSLTAQGSNVAKGWLGVEKLSFSLINGTLHLSQDEHALSLPMLTLSILEHPYEARVPFQLEIKSTQGIKAQLGGAFELVSNTKDSSLDVQLSLKMDPISCQNAFELIPKQALGPIEKLSLKGDFNPEILLTYRAENIDFSLKKFLRSCTFESLSFAQGSLLNRRVSILGHRSSEKDVLWLQEPFIFEVDPQFTSGAKVKVGPGTSSFVRLAELPSYIAGAMYLTEEMGFWTGGAISPSLIKNAINTNLSKGRFVYGGSTITQQLVKNLFLTRDKQLTRKLQEALISGRVIDAIGKERILELYLNCIEFGPGIFGIQKAAQYYFQKDARFLSAQQAVFLAMLKVSPSRGARWKRRGTSPTFTWWRERSVEVFKRLVDKGLLSAKQAQGKAPFVLKWSRTGDYLGADPLDL